MRRRAVHAGMHVVRHVALWMSGREALPERARRVVAIPVKRLDRLYALDRSKPERRNVRKVKDERGQPLFFGQPEFGSLFQRLACIAAGIGKADDVSPRRLRLEKER